MAAKLNRTRFGISVDYRGSSDMDTKLGSKTYNYLNFPGTANGQAGIVSEFLITVQHIFQRDKSGGTNNGFFQIYNPRMIRENEVVDWRS